MKVIFYRKTIYSFFITAFIIILVSVAGAAPKNGGRYNIPFPVDPATLDPAFITNIYSVTVANNIFDGLVEFDKDLNIVPAIAEIWKISRDHKTYTFNLLKNVRFHNGRKVTAEDFLYSFTRILNPETKSPVAHYFMCIEGAEEFHNGKASHVSGLRAPKRYTLQIKLKEPYTPFLSILAMVNAKVVPEEEVDSGFGKNPVGTGPFILEGWEEASEIVLSANTEYFEGRPHLDTLIFHIYPDGRWDNIFSDFQQGLLDQSIIPGSKYEKIVNDTKLKSKYRIVSKPTLNLVYIGMNTNHPALKYKLVRKAISYAVDTETIVNEITRRGSIPAKGILPPGLAGYDPGFDGYRYNPTKAGKLLSEAGFPEGEGIAPMEIWTVSKSDSVRRELEAYKDYLSEIGITLIPKFAKNWNHFISTVNSGKAPLFYSSWHADFPDPDNFLYYLCHSESKINVMSYRNPETDKLIEKARRETDYMKRVDMYRDIHRKVMSNPPVIVQHTNSFNYIFQPWLKGIEVSYLGSAYIHFRKVWIEYQYEDNSEEGYMHADIY